MAYSRWDDALFIQCGAVNPMALASTLVRHIHTAMEEGGGTDAARKDPACRLITHQLAYLMGLEFGWQNDEYSEAMIACAEKADPTVVKTCGAEIYLRK